jgi:hypothetical protein
MNRSDDDQTIALEPWRDLKELGFAGSAKQVRRWLNERRTAPAKTTPHQWRSDQSRTASDPVHGPAAALLSPRQLAWLLVRSPEALPDPASRLSFFISLLLQTFKTLFSRPWQGSPPASPRPRIRRNKEFRPLLSVC